jgi:hypothetical protein
MCVLFSDTINFFWLFVGNEKSTMKIHRKNLKKMADTDAEGHDREIVWIYGSAGAIGRMTYCP